MKSNEMIHCTIKILNSKDNNEILSGVSYYFTIKRNTLVKDLFSEFIKNFIDQEKIKQYNLYTNQQKLKLNPDLTIQDYFTNKNDSDLDIYDKDETIFYAII
tara:strand:- start:80 stop:385 length:306 start_codon:yes stop_codon:yes gene_type:complete